VSTRTRFQKIIDPRYNIAPTDRHFVITSRYESRRVLAARWGLVNSWAKDNSRAAACINAKAETVETRGAFREAFAQRRCLIPAEAEAVGAACRASPGL